MAAYTDPDAPWPYEEVKPSQLRVGDVIKPMGNVPWMQITQIKEIPATSPEWERQLGNRFFLLASIDAGNQILATYDGFDQRTVLRRTE